MGLDAEFEKLTVWCLYRNVLSFIALSGAVNFAELPFTNVKTGSIIFAAESDFVAFLARILTLFADYFSEKKLRDYIAAENVDLALFFRLAPEVPLGEFLVEKNLAFLAPKDKIINAVIKLLAGIEPCASVYAHLSSPAVTAENLREEPIIARLVGERLWRDCFEAFCDAELAGAVSKRPEVVRQQTELEKKKAVEKPRRQKGGKPGATRDKYNAAPARDGAFGCNAKGNFDCAEPEPEAELAVEFYELKFELNETVKLFFAPYIELLHVLSGASPAHQSELLNALALQWAKSGRAKVAAAGALRALFVLRAADYEGVTEWRCWMPPQELAVDEAETLKAARRQLMVAATEFLDVEMEEAHMLEVELKLKRDEESLED